MMKKPIVWELGTKCHICSKDRWIQMTDQMVNESFLLVSNSRESGFVTIKDKQQETRMIGISSHNKKLCFACFYLLVGLEHHYDAFFSELLDNEEAIEIVKKIEDDKTLRDEAFKFRAKGEFLPEEMISSIKKILEEHK